MMWNPESFKQCIESLIKEHQALIELAEKKKNILIHGLVAELGPLVNEEGRMVKRINTLEADRQSLIQSFLSSKGIPEADIPMKEMIGWMAPDDQRVFMELRDRLKGTVQQLKAMNELNQQLIKQSMDFVNYSLELYAEDFRQPATYQNPMKQAAMQRSRPLFDSKI